MRGNEAREAREPRASGARRPEPRLLIFTEKEKPHPPGRGRGIATPEGVSAEQSADSGASEAPAEPRQAE